LVDAVGFYLNFTKIKTSNFETTYCPGCVTDYCVEILMRPILFVKVNALDGAFTMVSYFSALTSSTVTQCINPGETYIAAIPWGYCFNISAMSFTPSINICNIQVNNDNDQCSVLGPQCFSRTYTCFIKMCIGNTEKSLNDPFSNTGYSNLYSGLVISIPIVNNATICTKGSGTVYYNVTFAVAWPCLGSILVNDGDQVYKVVTGYTYELQANTILKVENNPTPVLGIWGNYSGLIDAENNNYYILYPNDSVQLSNEIGMDAFYTPDYEIIVNRDTLTTANYFTLYCIEARIAEGDPPVFNIKISETLHEANSGSICFKGYVSYTNFSEGGFVEWKTLYLDSHGKSSCCIEIPINLNTSTQEFAVILSGNLTPASTSCTCACIKVSVSSTNYHHTYCIIHFLHSWVYTAHVNSIRINEVIIGYVSWESKGCTHITYTTLTHEFYNITVTYSKLYLAVYTAALLVGAFITFFGFATDLLVAHAAEDASELILENAVKSLDDPVELAGKLLQSLTGKVDSIKFIADFILNLIAIILNNLADATQSPVLCVIATILDLVTLHYARYLNHQLDDIARLIGYKDFDTLVYKLLSDRFLIRGSDNWLTKIINWPIDNLLIKPYIKLDIPHGEILEKADLAISDIIDAIGLGYDIGKNIYDIVSKLFHISTLKILSFTFVFNGTCICNAVNSHNLSKLPRIMYAIVLSAWLNNNVYIINNPLPGNKACCVAAAYGEAVLSGLGLCFYNWFKALNYKEIVTLPEAIATVNTTTAQCLGISICNILSK